MVLNHIFQSTRVVIVATTVLNADGFSKADLDIVDEVPIPYMLKNDVGKADCKDILDHFLA